MYIYWHCWKKSMWVHNGPCCQEAGVFYLFSGASFESLSRKPLSFQPVKALRKQPFKLLGNCSSTPLCFSEVTEWAESGFSLTTTKGKKTFLKTSLYHFLQYWPSDATPWWCSLSTLKALLNIERKFAASWTVCGFVCYKMFLFRCRLIIQLIIHLILAGSTNFLQGFNTHFHCEVNVTTFCSLSRWTIRARVTSKSSIRNWSNSRGDGKLFSFEIMDESVSQVWLQLILFFGHVVYQHWRFTLMLLYLGWDQDHGL